MRSTPLTEMIYKNLKTFEERAEFAELLENNFDKVNNSALASLYKSTIEKSHVNFDSIPKSKGDITKYNGYEQMTQCLSILKDMDSKHNLNIQEFRTVDNAIRSIINMKDIFEKGYRLNKKFVILQYNTLVASCVEATSALIASFVEFIKTPGDIEFRVINSRLFQGSTAIDNLKTFNDLVLTGDYAKSINTMLNADSENFLGGVALTVGAFAGIVGATRLMREGIYHMYYSRMKLSDFMKTQAMFLELNKQKVEASNLPPNKKQKILQKQADMVKKLTNWSDKIKVSNSLANREASEVKKEADKMLTMSNIKNDGMNDITQNDMGTIGLF